MGVKKMEVLYENETIVDFGFRVFLDSLAAYSGRNKGIGSGWSD
jgi:hypothetical protein